MILTRISEKEEEEGYSRYHESPARSDRGTRSGRRLLEVDSDGVTLVESSSGLGVGTDGGGDGGGGRGSGDSCVVRC